MYANQRRFITFDSTGNDHWQNSGILRYSLRRGTRTNDASPGTCRYARLPSDNALVLHIRYGSREQHDFLILTNTLLVPLSFLHTRIHVRTANVTLANPVNRRR